MAGFWDTLGEGAANKLLRGDDDGSNFLQSLFGDDTPNIMQQQDSPFSFKPQVDGDADMPGLLGQGGQNVIPELMQVAQNMQNGGDNLRGGLLGNPQDPRTVAQAYIAGGNEGYKPEMLRNVITGMQKADERRGGFKDTASQTTALSSLRDRHEKFVAKPRASIESFQETSDLIRNSGGFTKMSPQDDLAMIANFAKMQRPGEALMEGDVTNILRSSGYDEMVKAWVSARGGKALDIPVRERIYKTMNSLAGSNIKRYKDIRDQTQTQFEDSGFAQDVRVPMRGLLELNPYSKPSRRQQAKTELTAAQKKRAEERAKEVAAAKRQTALKKKKQKKINAANQLKKDKARLKELEALEKKTNKRSRSRGR